jgi:tryptophan 2,3-dioxygenase
MSTTHLPCGHEVLDPAQVHYCDYIQDPLIQALLRPKGQGGAPREFAHPDEFQFILVHQSCELSFAGCLYELERAVLAIEGRDLPRAAELVGRCRSWLLLAARQLQHLVDHLTPEDFAYFRVYLSPASGAESIRFRLVEIASGVRPDAPYVGHRGRSFTFREFLDRGPMEGEGRPKTRWWTPEMEARAARPTLASASDALFGVAGLSEPEQVVALSAVWRGERGEEARGLAEALYGYERAVRAIRKVHLNAARRHVNETPGTGHTDGVLYLRSVLETARSFPALTAAAEGAGAALETSYDHDLGAAPKGGA